MTDEVKIDLKGVKRLLRAIGPGLCDGSGDTATPGEMCVQNAVAYAFGDVKFGQNCPTDQPSCVALAPTQVGVALNDLSHAYQTDKQRARALRRFAVAQLGTNSAGYIFKNDQFWRELKAKARVNVGLKLLSRATRVKEAKALAAKVRKHPSDPNKWRTEMYELQERIERDDEDQGTLVRYALDFIESPHTDELGECLSLIESPRTCYQLAKAYADTAADVLQEMGTPGSNYLCLIKGGK